MAGGIIEYLAEGAWTKRMHAGWAAQSGIRAALLGRAGFFGPRTVFESNAKRADEHIVLEDLRRATKVIARMLLDLLA